MVRPLLALVMLPLLAVAAPVPKSVKNKKDAASMLVGIWKPVGKSEWFQFDADGGMKAWMTDSASTPALYTVTVEPDPDGQPWRMTWTRKGRQQPTCDAVFIVDGDEMRLQYTSAGGGSLLPKPGTDPADKFSAFTREPGK